MVFFLVGTPSRSLVQHLQVLNGKRSANQQVLKQKQGQALEIRKVGTHTHQGELTLQAQKNKTI